MLQIKDWLPLIGVAVGALLGWFLNQLGQWLVVRRDERMAIARALSDLLEIRHRLLALPKAAEALSQHFGMPSEHQTVVKVVLAQLLPQDADLPKRYAESVSLVAAADPLLGFQLRSKDIVVPFLDQLRRIALNDPSAMAAFSGLEKELMEHLKPHLEQSIRELAWLHGYLTWLRVQRQLKRPLELPAGLVQSLKAHLPKVERKAQGAGDLP